MTEIVLRHTRDEIAAIEYDGPESVPAVLMLRDRIVTVAQAMKRARVDAREALWAAREAERALGRMILAAREVGDLAGEGRRTAETVGTLDSFGISRDLGAYAVRLAAIPDDVWAHWHESEVEPSKVTIDANIKRYRAGEQADRDRAADRARLAETIAAIDAAAAAARPVPPLTDAELSPVTNGGVPLPFDTAATAWTRQLGEMERVAELLSDGPPLLPDGDLRAQAVRAARNAARLVTDALADWVRAINEEAAAPP